MILAMTGRLETSKQNPTSRLMSKTSKLMSKMQINNYYTIASL